MIALISESGIDGITAFIKLIPSNKTVEFEQATVKRAKSIVEKNNLTSDLQYGVDWVWDKKPREFYYDNAFHVVHNRKTLSFVGKDAMSSFLRWLGRQIS